MSLIETENDSHSKHEATNSCGLSILAASRDVPNVISSLLCPGTAALYVSPDLWEPSCFSADVNAKMDFFCLQIVEMHAVISPEWIRLRD